MKENYNCQFQANYPHLVKKTLFGIARVQLTSGQFELGKDQNYSIDDSVKSAIIFSVQVDVTNPKSAEKGFTNDLIPGGGGQMVFKCGSYQAPIVRPEFNRDGDHVNNTIVGLEWKY